MREDRPMTKQKIATAYQVRSTMLDWGVGGRWTCWGGGKLDIHTKYESRSLPQLGVHHQDGERSYNPKKIMTYPVPDDE